MIAVQLILRGRDIRAAMGSPVGIGGLYKSIATILVESSALFAVSSLLVIGLWAAKNPVANAFTPILSKTQVRAFPRLWPSDQSPYVTTERTGHRFTAHH